MEQSAAKMPQASSADFCARVWCPVDREYRRTSRVHVDRSHNSVYVGACRSSSRLPPWGVTFGYSHHTAATGSRGGLDEYHSVPPHRGPVGVWNEAESHGWAARGALER